MSLTQEQALTILHALIAKPETNSEDVAQIWDDVLNVYNKHFAAQPERAQKPRRPSTRPNIGWPAGVTRAEYSAWKEAMQSEGATEGLNPNEYKRLRDAGLLQASKKRPRTKKGTPSAIAEFKKPTPDRGTD